MEEDKKAGKGDRKAAKKAEVAATAIASSDSPKKEDEKSE